MSDDMGTGDDVEQLASIMSDLAEALSASTVTVKLENSREIVGPILGFSLRRKERKGEVSWSGNVRVQIDTGELEIDCQTIKSVTPK